MTRLDADYARTLTQAAGASKLGPPSTAGLPPFGSGAMGGFYTLGQVNTWLDSIASHDPSGLVSSVVTIGTSRQNRAIRAVRIANEAPRSLAAALLFTALTHAREPGGMQACCIFSTAAGRLRRRPQT